MAQEYKSFVTPEFTLYFPELEAPSRLDKNKFQIVAVFDAGADLTVVKTAMKEAARSKWPNKVPPDLYVPLKSQAQAKNPDWYPENTLHLPIKKTIKFPPYFVDRDENRALTPDKFYGGCRCRAIMHFYPYDSFGDNTPGLSATLDMLQFVSDGERLGGGVGAAKSLLAASPLSAPKTPELPTGETSDDPFDFEK